ncbi:hypothetical protein ACHAXT_000202 [Thalassiosira profunda]
MSPEAEVAQLKSEISQLSYLMKQMTNQLAETQDLSRRAEARAYIIEEKLMDIQKHVVKIPALETLAQSLRTYLTKVSPQWANVSGGVSVLTSKYTAWGLFVAVILFWQYRRIAYQRTSEEVANVAAMTLQQENLRTQIQETLTTVANSPETLASLSVLFQKLITDEKTEQHLINLIVRALNSEGVRDAAIHLLDFSFQNKDLQVRAGDFLKVAANATVLDEGVQKSAGVGIQQALRSAVLPWWARGNGHNGNAEEETDSDSKQSEHGKSPGNEMIHQ